MSIARYSDDLQVLMKKLVLLSEVASLSVLPHVPSFPSDLEQFSHVSRENIEEVQDKRKATCEETSRLELLNKLEEFNEPVKSKAWTGVSS